MSKKIKAMDFVIGNTKHSDHEYHGHLANIILDRNPNGNGGAYNSIFVRNTEYDTQNEVQKEIEPHVAILSKDKTIFSGSFNQLVSKITNPSVDDPSMMATIMSEFVNVMVVNDRINGFVEKMCRIHRTLQATFTQLCFAWIKKQASLKEYEYDERNMFEVNLCKKIVKNTEELQ